MANSAGVVTYQSPSVPRGLYSTGNVFINRDGQGSDDPSPVGCEPVDVVLSVVNGRDPKHNLSLEQNGFQLFDHVYDHIDYLDEEQIVGRYYAECENLIKVAIGASRVVAFDHNVRSAEKNSWMNQGGTEQTTKAIKGGNAIQSPALVVHNDYTLTSAPARLKLLTDAPKLNDTWAKRTLGKPLIDPSELNDLLSKRYAFINVWRNISIEPISDTPLAMCDAQSIADSDLITFEIRYADRYVFNSARGYGFCYCKGLSLLLLFF